MFTNLQLRLIFAIEIFNCEGTEFEYQISDANCSLQDIT